MKRAREETGFASGIHLGRGSLLIMAGRLLTMLSFHMHSSGGTQIIEDGVCLQEAC